MTMARHHGPPVDIEESTAEEGEALLGPHHTLMSLGSHDVSLRGMLARSNIRRILIASWYLLLSTGMILYNKHLMSKDRFPFPAFIVLCHASFTLILAVILLQIWPSLFPSAALLLRGKVFTGFSKGGSSFNNKQEVLLRFFPVGALSGINLIMTTSAYHYNGVSELQVVKETSVVMVYALSVIAGTETLNMRNAGLLFACTACAMTAVCGGGSQMMVRGLALQFGASMCQSVQVVLTSIMMSHHDGPKVDPMTMVLCTAPATLCVLGPVAYCLWDPLIVLRMALWWPQLFASAFCAFALQVFTSFCICELTATGMQLISVTKDLAIVAAAAYLLHEHLTSMQLGGFAGAVASITAYFWMKSRADWT